MEKTALPPGCYAMGITPFKRNGDLDEGALRAHIQWLNDANVGFWPASPATGEASLMSDAEVFRTWEITVDVVAGKIPVVAGSREFPTAQDNLAFASEAKRLGLDGIQLYPLTMGHSFIPSAAMLESFYDQVLSAVEIPVVLSSNLSTGFEVAASIFDKLIDDHPSVIGVFKHHTDQQNVAEFVARFAPRTTVLTMTQRHMFAFAVGSSGELDNLQNIAPRLCRSLHDALQNQDLATAAQSYRTIVDLWAGIQQFSAEFSAPRVVIYKAILRILGGAGGWARSPYQDLSDDAVNALSRMVAAVGLREIEGL